MIQKSIYSFYYFGTCFRYLQDAPKVSLRTKERGGILDNIEYFLNTLPELGLEVTSRITNELVVFSKNLKKLDPTIVMTDEQSTELTTLMRSIRATLDAEIQGFKAYVVTPKRLDVKKLLDDVPNLLAPAVYSKLPSISQYDLAEAGKCIAFERPTAAAFHLLRGTEGVLKAFYCTIVRQKRVAFMWGPMIIDLRKRRKAVNFTVLLDNLDNIRRSFRNPTQHPELTYDIHEVQDLFGLCTDAVNRMAAVL